MALDWELEQVLPQDLPNRENIIVLSALYLNLLLEANQHMNLTRITEPREAAIKHILDSVLPWRHLQAAQTVLDAGTGAGLPGIPLSMVFPKTRFFLVESTQKKARFVESAVEALGLSNVDVIPERAEDVLRRRRVDLITARAVAPLDRALPLFASAIKAGSVAYLYKGPDVQAEIDASAGDARNRRIAVEVVERYELPDSFGHRTLVRMHSVSAKA